MACPGALLAAILILQEGAAKLDEAADKLSSASSYAYTIETKVKGLPGGSPPGTIEGIFEKDAGLRLKIDRVEIVRIGDKTAMTQEDGGWEQVDLDAKKGEKKKGQGRADAARELPHEMLAGLGKKFSKFEGNSGELAPSSALELLGGSLKKLGKGASVTATAQVAINADGHIEKIEINGTAKGKVKDQDVEVSFSRTITMTRWNEAKADIPDAAKKALGGK